MSGVYELNLAEGIKVHQPIAALGEKPETAGSNDGNFYQLFPRKAHEKDLNQRSSDFHTDALPLILKIWQERIGLFSRKKYFLM